MTAGAERRLAQRARELANRGPDALEVVPAPEEVAQRPDAERHEVLQGLRLELYAIASMLADATLRRARRERDSHQPYGLVRSMHSESRLLVASPEPVQEGSIASFHDLGKAYVDTTVFHLHHQFEEADQQWLVKRLEQLLVLFRIKAGPLTRSRMRDGLSFIYGGLHFGTGVCVQLAEVMSRLLDASPDMGALERAEIMTRSIRPAYRLAALNIDHVVLTYQWLQEPVPHQEDTTGAGKGPTDKGPASWMKAEAFTVHHSGGRPWRIDLLDEGLLGPEGHGRRLDEIPTLYETQGCPARVSPSGGASPIAVLWSWCVELAHDTGLLGGGTGTDADTGTDQAPR